MTEPPDDANRLPDGAVAMLGIGWDDNSSHLRGAADGPAAIRAVLRSGASNLCAEDGTDLGAEPRFRDAGDVGLAPGESGAARIEAAVTELLARGARVLSLGGDHSITYPVLRAYAREHAGLGVLHFDAHPDLYDEYDGNPLSHACPFARIMEEGLARRLVQIGIRTMNSHQRAQADRFGVDVIEMRGWRAGHALDLEPPVYVTIDLDALDPAYAPGVSHHEPGGLSVRDVIDLIQRVPGPIVGADVVELNPRRDEHDRTAAVAAKLVKELAARLLET